MAPGESCRFRTWMLLIRVVHSEQVCKTILMMLYVTFQEKDYHPTVQYSLTFFDNGIHPRCVVVLYSSLFTLLKLQIYPARAKRLPPSRVGGGGALACADQVVARTALGVSGLPPHSAVTVEFRVEGNKGSCHSQLLLNTRVRTGVV